MVVSTSVSWSPGGRVAAMSGSRTRTRTREQQREQEWQPGQPFTFPHSSSSPFSGSSEDPLLKDIEKLQIKLEEEELEQDNEAIGRHAAVNVAVEEEDQEETNSGTVKQETEEEYEYGEKKEDVKKEIKEEIVNSDAEKFRKERTRSKLMTGIIKRLEKKVAEETASLETTLPWADDDTEVTFQNLRRASTEGQQQHRDMEPGES